MPVEGWALNYGSRFLAGHRPDHSAYLVRRLREAGFVIVGHHEPAGVRDPADDRAAPHRPDAQPVGPGRARPAGRPAASAAAVAAGMVPLAHGNDGGGSIRIPAACCGLVGLKPSRGRVSRGPDLGDSWLACDGVLTRTVADTALALDVLGGYEVGDANWAPRPIEPYATAMRRDPGQAADRGHRRQPVRRRRRRGGDRRPARGRRAAARRSATRSSRPRRRGRRRSAGRSSSTSSGRRSRSGSTPASCAAGREPGEDEIEPLSRALLRARAGDAVDRLPGRDRPAAGARAAGWWPSSPTTTCCVTPGAGRAAAADRRVQRPGRGAAAGPRALRPLHALHVAVQRHRPARDLGAGRASAPTACRPASRSSASR